MVFVKKDVSVIEKIVPCFRIANKANTKPRLVCKYSCLSPFGHARTVFRRRPRETKTRITRIPNAFRTSTDSRLLAVGSSGRKFHRFQTMKRACFASLLGQQSFFGQSFSLGHYPPIYQPPKGVYLLYIYIYIYLVNKPPFGGW